MFKRIVLNMFGLMMRVVYLQEVCEKGKLFGFLRVQQIVHFSVKRNGICDVAFEEPSYFI